MYAWPRITTLDAHLLPTAPEGWKYANLTEPFGTTPDLAHYPVLLFGPYTYTALSDINDTYNMLIVAWDMKRNLVKQWTKPDSRSVWQISFKADFQLVTFTGHRGTMVTATLDELTIGPTVVHLPISSGPVLPYTLSYATSTGSTADFPVIKGGPYSFWPASYADGRNAFCVVVVDHDNVIRTLIDCPGSHTIDRIVVNDAAHTIHLFGKNSAAAKFDYNTALTCFSCAYAFTKHDFLFLAQYFKVQLSDAQAIALAKAMPQLDCSLCCRMEGTRTASEPESDRAHRRKRDTGLFVVGSLLGGAAGGFFGFWVGGPPGAFVGLTAGFAAGGAIGVAVPSSSDKGEYQLSSLEQQHSLVGYARFPCGPFDNTGVRENVFDAPFLRYAQLPYSGALTTPGPASSPRAYSPATQAIGDLPRDPRYKAVRLASGIQVAKYIFVIVQTDKTASDGHPGYQMRINPEDFYPDTWIATQRVNHSQLSEGYRFWALVGHPHMQVYTAGSVYVDITHKKLLGIDTRTGHYFGSFMGQDRAVNDATLGFLKNLGYDTSGMKHDADMIGYFQENPIVG